MPKDVEYQVHYKGLRKNFYSYNDAYDFAKKVRDEENYTTYVLEVTIVNRFDKVDENEV